MLINSPNISGSLTVTGNSVITGSLTVLGGINATIEGTAATASYVEYTNVANKPPLVSGSEQISYSGLSGVPSGIVSSSAQVGEYGVFATTGSNQFNGSQAITGSLTVTGEVVAQTLNVQQVTSSIVYSSGSNVFGNDLGNTQQFTGSVSVTGSLTVNGTSAVTGTGTTNYLPKFTGSTTVGNSNLINDSSGNLGLGVTPSAWSGRTAIQLPDAAYVVSSGNSILLGANVYFDGSNRTYISTAAATDYRQVNGEHRWEVAPSGTAGETISFTQAMTLSAAGRLLIGKTNDEGYTLDVNGTGRFISSGGYFSIDSNGQVTSTQSLDVATAGGRFTGMSSRGALGAIHIEQTTTGANGGYIAFRTSDVGSTTPTEKVRITSGGNVGIGTVSPRSIDSTWGILTINGSSGGSMVQLRRGDVNAGYLYSDIFGTTLFETRASSLVFGTNDTERMRITSGGNIGIGTTIPVSNDGDSRTLQLGNRLVIQNVIGSQFLLGTNCYYDGVSWKYIAAAKAQAVRGTGESGAIQFSLSATGTAGGTIANMDGSDVKMIILDSGNVGIGTTSPAEIFHVNKNSAGNVVGGYFTNSQANTGAESVSLAFGLNRSGGDFVRQIKAITFGAEQQWTGTPSTVDGYLAFSTVADENVAERMRITSGGDVGIGTNSPLQTSTNRRVLTINGTTSSLINIAAGGSLGSVWYTDGSYTQFYGIGTLDLMTGTANPILFSPNNTERMRITSVGEVQIGTTSIATDNGIQLYPTGEIYSHRSGTDSTNQMRFYRNNSVVGSITTDGTSTAYVTSSDYRLKINLNPINNALQKLSELNPLKFNFISEPENEIMGFLAHEVQQVVPNAVYGQKDAIDGEGNPVYQGIDHSKLIPLLTAALQEQQSQIEILKTKIEILEQS